MSLKQYTDCVNLRLLKTSKIHRNNTQHHISYQSVKVSSASQKYLKHTNSSRRGCPVSSADGSRTAYSLADFEFHPSSFGHSYQYKHTMNTLYVHQHLQEPLSIWKFCQFLNYWFTEGVVCQQLPKQLCHVDHNKWVPLI